MKLKDVIRADVSRVFLNTDDFAELISIEGVEAPAICEWSVQPEGAHLFGDTGDDIGINAIHASIMLADDVIPQPETGQDITVNGKNWTVRSASAEGGLLKIVLFRNAA